MKDCTSEVFNIQSSAYRSAIDNPNLFRSTASPFSYTPYRDYSINDTTDKDTNFVPTTPPGSVPTLIHCNSVTAHLPSTRISAQYYPFSLDLTKKPPKFNPQRQDQPKTHVDAIDRLLEQPLTQRQLSAYKPGRYRHNSGRNSTSKVLLPRRSVSGSSLDNLFSSLNFNELTLSSVHVAMGKDGAAQAICPQKEAYYRKIFEQLDIDRDGKVDVTELKQAYNNMGLLQVPGQAEKFVTASDSNKDGELDVSEFIRYLHEHEMKLKLMFKKMDRDKDGKISTNEMMQSLKSVGLSISNEEASAIVKRMDKDGTSSIDLDEWVEHHLLHPSTDIKDILYYWKHATYIDIGENLLVPDDFTEEEKTSGKWWKVLIAGGVAGTVSRTSTAPLDRLKVLMQVHATKANQLGIRSGFKDLLNEGGIRGLWRGNGINVLKIAPESALKFFAFERLKPLIGGNASSQEMSMKHRFVAGSLAGAFSQTCIYPMEVIKTRLALRKTGEYNGILDCAVKILKREGPGAFFKGYLPNILGILPYAGIDLCIYETLRNYWVKHHSPDNKIPSVPLLLMCGMTSSTCGQLASYPLALIRTKMQANKGLVKRTQDPSMLSLVRTIYQNEGFTGFYRGIGPNFLKVAPAVSISYVVYEKMRLHFGI